MENTLIKALFLDIGGVLLTNGWGRDLRRKACEVFDLEADEVDERHHLVFDTYETGKSTLDQYLAKVVFYKERSFSIEKFKTFMFESASPHTDMIDYIKMLKKKYNLLVAAVSNEGRELAVDRISRFNLSEFIDFFIVSSFVHFRKPDQDIFSLALDTAQVPPTQVAYIDDRGLFVEVAKGFGIQGVHHTSLDSTKLAFNMLLPEE